MVFSRGSTGRLVLEVKCIAGDTWKFRAFHPPGSTAEAGSVTCRGSHCIPDGTAGTLGIALQFLLESPSHPPGSAQTIFAVFFCLSLAVPSSGKGLR